MTGGLLLTDEEIKKHNAPWKSNALSQWMDEWDIDGLLKAQLAKAKPLIEKAERERILTILANNTDLCFNYSDEREYCAKYADCEECFRQALKD